MRDAALWDIETIDVEQRLDFYERIEENVTFAERLETSRQTSWPIP